MNEINDIKHDYHLATAESRFNQIQSHYNGNSGNRLTIEAKALYEYVTGVKTAISDVQNHNENEADNDLEHAESQIDTLAHINGNKSKADKILIKAFPNAVFWD